MIRARNALIAVAVGIAPMTGVAQSNGWAKLGESLAGGSAQTNAAYTRGIIRGAEQADAINSARLAQAEARIAEAEASTRAQLQPIWKSAFGLSDQEATAIAQSFRLTDQQAAINARAEREGFQSTVEAARAAYYRYDYLLANQILVALMRLPPPPQQ